MGEDHRVEQADPLRDWRGSQVGERGEQVSAEENGAERGRLDAVAKVEPVCHQALDNKAAGEGVKSEQGGKLRHRTARALHSKPAPRPCGDAWPSLYSQREAHKKAEQYEPGDRITPHQDAIACQWRQTEDGR